LCCFAESCIAALRKVRRRRGNEVRRVHAGIVIAGADLRNFQVRVILIPYLTLDLRPG
jgi:hypothetical protein